jgi:hypothetical protein
MSHIIELGGAVKDGEAPPPLNWGYVSWGYLSWGYMLKLAVPITGETKEAL